MEGSEYSEYETGQFLRQKTIRTKRTEEPLRRSSVLLPLYIYTPRNHHPSLTGEGLGASFLQRIATLAPAAVIIHVIDTGVRQSG